MEKSCRCGGMNEECIFCGGTGVIKDKEIEIIKTDIDKNKINKENSDLQAYLNPKTDKLYVSNNKPLKKKKTIFNKLGEVKKEHRSKLVRPNNPNKKKMRDTRKQANSKKAKGFKSNATENNIDAKVRSSAELEFLLFWKNNIKRKTKDSEEFKVCLVLFLKLTGAKREKFKNGIVKKKPPKFLDIGTIAQELYNKLVSS